MFILGGIIVKQTTNEVWKKNFAIILKRVFCIYNLNYESCAEQYYWSSSTFRYWFTGRNLPRMEALNTLKSYLHEHIVDNDIHNEQLFEEIRDMFNTENNVSIYYNLRRIYPHVSDFVSEVLTLCYDFAKNKNFIQLQHNSYPPTGKTKAVVFDFDGTLTTDKLNKTTWENLWTILGYDIKLCQDLHMKYDRKEITHKKWCKLTEEKFKQRFLNQTQVNDLALQIHLLPGVKETFLELQKRNIRIYIVSGSISTIIRSVIGDLCQYVDDIKANEFIFDENNVLDKIIGTKYDFEGKADFINNISQKLEISPKDILFVGNSINDRFAYTSGARTLCINPKLTDISNRLVWNECLTTCNDLTDILKFI